MRKQGSPVTVLHRSLTILLMNTTCSGLANSVDPDQLAKPTDLDLHCLLRQGILTDLELHCLSLNM